MADAPDGKATVVGAGPGAAGPPTFRGARATVREVGEVPGAEPVVPAATDSGGLPGLEALGWPCEGSVAMISRALLDGEAVVLHAEVPWPLPPLPTSARGPYTVRLTDRAVEPGEREVLLRPPSLVIGVGASKGVPAEEVLRLIGTALREARLSPRCVAELATLDAKSAEPGLVAAAGRLGVPLVSYSAAELAAVEVPNPSGALLAAVDTPSVAEAAALVRGGELLVPKRRSERADGQPAMATCAVVRRPGRGQHRERSHSHAY